MVFDFLSSFHDSERFYRWHFEELQKIEAITATVCLKINYIIGSWFVDCFHLFPLNLSKLGYRLGRRFRLLSHNAPRIPEAEQNRCFLPSLTARAGPSRVLCSVSWPPSAGLTMAPCFFHISPVERVPEGRHGGCFPLRVWPVSCPRYLSSHPIDQNVAETQLQGRREMQSSQWLSKRPVQGFRHLEGHRTSGYWSITELSSIARLSISHEGRIYLLLILPLTDEKMRLWRLIHSSRSSS